MLTKNKTEMVSISVVCPECHKKKNIDVPKRVFDEATNIITLSIPKKLVCEHNLQAYVDKNLIVRGYQRVDYEYDRFIDKIINEFSLKGDFCNIVTAENKKIAYCSKGPKTLLMTLATLACRDVELRVYTEHVATNVELIMSGTYNIDVQIPQIVRSIAKTRGGELPKGQFSVKIIMTGNFQAGKSSLVNKFVQNQFNKNYQSTIGVDITEKLMEISNKTKILFMLWDIGGQITHMAPYRNKFYEGANAAFIVIDRTRYEQLKSVELWYTDIKKYIPKDLDVVLIGNKSDLLDKIVVSEEEIKKVADKHGFHYILTSAKTGENVSDAFLYIAYKFLEKIAL